MSSDSEVPFDEITEAPLGDAFLSFMNQRGENDARHSEIRDWLQTRFNTKSERFLASFALISTGCWNRGQSDVHVAGDIVERLDSIHDIRDRSLQEELATDIQNSLEQIDSSASRWDWLHNHRKSLHFQLSQRDAGRAVVDTLSGLATVVGKHDDIGGYVEEKVSKEKDPFFSIFSDTKSIDEFSRLSAFDFLEIADTAGRINGISPGKPRFEYVCSNHPRPGFCYVFLADGPEDGGVEEMDVEDVKDQLNVSEDGLDELVKLLCETAQDRLNWSEDVVMYDVESCLCIFAKDVNNRQLSVNSENNGGGTTGRGC
jgi:hypothetical protein